MLSRGSLAGERARPPNSYGVTHRCDPPPGLEPSRERRVRVSLV